MGEDAGQLFRWEGAAGMAVLKKQESGRQTACLGDPVRDEDDGVTFRKLQEQILDVAGTGRVEGCRRLVQQEDLRLQGQRAGQTEALLLAAGKGAGRVAQPVMDFRPQAHVFQTAPGP